MTNPNVRHITSNQNPKIKLIQKLRSKRGRKQHDRFVIDYQRDLEHALLYNYQVDFVLFCPQLDPDQSSQSIISTLPDIYEVPLAVMEKASYRQNPTPLLAVMHQSPRPLLEPNIALDASHILVLVGLEKPGNIGALLRTANASDIPAIWLIDTQLDLMNPNIIRASTGACFTPNITHGTTKDAISLLRYNGYTVIAGHPSGNQPYYAVDMRQKVAIVLGAEDTGLDEAWIKNSDILANIPMHGDISDSLNVSVSGALFMYEILRQTHYLST